MPRECLDKVLVFLRLWFFLKSIAECEDELSQAWRDGRSGSTLSFEEDFNGAKWESSGSKKDATDKKIPLRRENRNYLRRLFWGSFVNGWAPKFGHYIALLSFFLLSMAAYVHFFPLLFMDETFAIWNAKLNLLERSEDPEFVIIGDSRPMHGLIPSAFPQKTISLAIQGGSSIEGYFLLRSFLEKHRAPKKIIYSISPIRFEKAEY